MKTQSEKQKLLNKMKQPILKDYYAGKITYEQYTERLKEIYKKVNK